MVVITVSSALLLLCTLGEGLALSSRHLAQNTQGFLPRNPNCSPDRPDNLSRLSSKLLPSPSPSPSPFTQQARPGIRQDRASSRHLRQASSHTRRRDAHPRRIVTADIRPITAEYPSLERPCMYRLAAVELLPASRSPPDSDRSALCLDQAVPHTGSTTRSEALYAGPQRKLGPWEHEYARLCRGHTALLAPLAELRENRAIPGPLEGGRRILLTRSHGSLQPFIAVRLLVVLLRLLVFCLLGLRLLLARSHAFRTYTDTLHRYAQQFRRLCSDSGAGTPPNNASPVGSRTTRLSGHHVLLPLELSHSQATCCADWLA